MNLRRIFCVDGERWSDCLTPLDFARELFAALAILAAFVVLTAGLFAWTG